MGTLNAALAWAARGFPVFPLRENTREPAFADVDWNTIATTDANEIRRLWTDPVLGTERDYNVGCCCTDYVVIDIDVKKGKPGLERYQAMGGTFDTLVVQTTTGGYHCYFLGPSSSNAPLDKDGVDVRSHRGYVVAPGSSIDGVAYKVVNDVDPVWIPDAISVRLTPPDVRNEMSKAEVVDGAASIQAAINYLHSCPPAIEGASGDNTTFVTACHLVRELALSPEAALGLMWEHYNPRCVPPWTYEELYTKVNNAYNYGTDTAGRLTPETLFGHVHVQDAPSAFGDLAWGNAVGNHAIRPRPWLIERMLMLKEITVLLASGSSGKSSLALLMAAHLAMGLDFAGNVTRRPCKTIIYNAEDDIEEQSRRLIALCTDNGFDYERVKKSIMLISSRDLKLTLVAQDGRRVVKNDTLIRHLIDQASDPDVGMLVLDPLVKVHQCDENDNVAMDAMTDVLKDIADAANVAVLALHHTSKSNERSEYRVGNPEIARGASSVVNAARIAYTLINSTQQDAEDFGFPDSERRMWVRLDDAKMNLTLAGESCVWFKRTGVKIYSGDLVGVLKQNVLTKSRDHITKRIAAVITTAITATGHGSMSLGSAVPIVRAGEPLWANKTETDIRRLLESMFSNGFGDEGNKLTLVREEDADGKQKRAVFRIS